MTWIALFIERFGARLWLGVALVAGALAFINYAGRVQAERYQAKAEQTLAEYRLDVAQATVAAQEQVRLREQAALLEAERIARETYAKEQELARRAASASAAVVSLRDEIARLNARPTPGNTPEDAPARAFAHEARTARELLGSCADEYRDLATKADGLRIQVIGLHDYVNTILMTSK